MSQPPPYPKQEYEAPPPGQAPYPQVNYDNSSGQVTAPPGQVLYPQAQYQPGTVIITVPIVFREPPVQMKCQHCQKDIVTNTEKKIGLLPWLACGGVFLGALLVFPLGILGCCFIPFCIPSLKDVEHTCPNCKQVLGRYKRM